MGRKIILAGGSGFIGSMLSRRLCAEGWEVVVLTRRPPEAEADGIVAVQWPARPIAGSNPTSFHTHGSWVQAMDGAEAVVNLAGRSVNCAHTPDNRRKILESRIDAVRVLGAALGQCRQPPRVWVQCSALGYYGNHGLPACDEHAPSGATFLSGVCAQWENEFASHCPASVRPVILRLGMVLGKGGGAFPPLARLARCFLGGAAGEGTQGISWIHERDLEGIFLHALSREAVRGVYNACAPSPVANAEFMRLLRKAVGRPWCPAAPAAAVRLAAKLILRTDPSLVLEGQFAVPARLLAEGYQFKYAQLAVALRNLSDAHEERAIRQGGLF